MNNKPSIAEPESDASVLLVCLNSHKFMHGLLHKHAVSVLGKYSKPAELARQIIETAKKSARPTLIDELDDEAIEAIKKSAEATLSLKVRQLLYDRVFVSGTREEKRSLLVEAKIFDEDYTDCAA